MPPTKEEMEKLFERVCVKAADSHGPPERDAESSVRKSNRRRFIEQSSEQKTELSSAYAFKLFDTDEVVERLESVSLQKDSKELQVCLRKMRGMGGRVMLKPQPNNYEKILDGLEKRYPHFFNVVDFIRKRMRLNALKGHPVLSFGSILLDGPAGTGKTSFLMDLSTSFDTQFLSISSAAVSSSYDLTGLSGVWANSRAGKVFEILIYSACPNPIVLLDELDKASHEDDRHSFSGALYGLLEKNNAKRFRDEFIDVTMDASRINWFGTSNDLSRLDAPILDRFEVINVRAPNQCDLEKIVPQLFRQTVYEHELQSVFVTELNKEVIKKMLSYDNISIRRIKSAIETALSNAAVRVKGKGVLVSLKVEDIPDIEASGVDKKRIGFIH